MEKEVCQNEQVWKVQEVLKETRETISSENKERGHGKIWRQKSENQRERT